MEDRFKFPWSHSAMWPALALSALLHALALLAIAVLLGAVMQPDRGALPEAIQFIFVPVEEALPEAAEHTGTPPIDKHSSADQIHKSAPSVVDLTPSETDNELATPSPQFAGGFPSKPKQTPLTSENIDSDLTESSPRPQFLPNAPVPATLKSTHFYSPERRFSLPKEKLVGEDVRLAPPQLAIPTAKQEWLLKEMRKLTDHFVPPTQSDSVFVWEKDGADYEITIKHHRAETVSAFDKLDVYVRTERYGRTLSTTLEMQRVGFSQFAQFVDYWDPYVMVHDDRFDGRFHTNSDFKLSSSRGVHPKFQGKVTSAGFEMMQQSDPFGYASRDSIFKGGLETGTAEIKFPRKLYELISATTSDSALLKLTGESTVHFSRDGSVRWRADGEKPAQGSIQLSDAPFTILGESSEKMFIEGTVRGKVLIYNRGTIEITGNLTYAKSPEIFDHADDFLGVVSEKNIEIAPVEKVGPDDLHIYAALLAKRLFKVRDFSKSIHKTLYIYGSLSAGSITATEPRYATHIRFDKRLQTRRPPHFPMTDRYEMQNWQANWQVEPAPPK